MQRAEFPELLRQPVDGMAIIYIEVMEGCEALY